jgi:hypothetical protein
LPISFSISSIALSISDLTDGFPEKNLSQNQMRNIDPRIVMSKINQPYTNVSIYFLRNVLIIAVIDPIIKIIVNIIFTGQSSHNGA